MRVQPIQPQSGLANNSNGERRDAPKMTIERALEYIEDFDPGVVVDLNSKDIPAFLYNKDGKIK